MFARFSRLVCPAWLDTCAFSCATVTFWNSRVLFCTTCIRNDSGPNKEFVVNPVFFNRNPRNLESMGLERKREGWPLQYPRANYYHKIIFEKTNRHTTGRVEHCTGKTIVSASTKEWAIQEQLYSTRDVSAAENIGRILAQRCLECGITNIFYDEEPDHEKSEKMQAFLAALKEGQVILEEPEYIKPEYQPGTDYDRPNRYGEKKKWKDDYQPA